MVSGFESLPPSQFNECGAREADDPARGIAERSLATMFVIELTYKVDLARIDAAMKAHVAWLRQHYAAGTFLVSGRKVPRDGGVIIATGTDRDVIEATIRQDPFVETGLAEYRLIEFRASQKADDLPRRIE